MEDLLYQFEFLCVYNNNQIVIQHNTSSMILVMIYHLTMQLSFLSILLKAKNWRQPELQKISYPVVRLIHSPDFLELE